MSDYAFTFADVPNLPADRVQRAAVLYAICGKQSNKREIINKTQLVVRLWRRRLSELWANEWRPRQSGLAYQCARNCCPTFAYPNQFPKCCRLSDICPFCYARNVHKLWNLLSARLAPRDSPPRYDLLELQRSRVFPFCPALPGGELMLMEARLQQLFPQFAAERLATLGPKFHVGGYYKTTLVPVKDGWKVVDRCLVVLKTGSAVPPALLSWEEIQHHPLPTFGDLMSITARVCRYPVGLLRSKDVEAVGILLAARQSYPARLSATFGILYKRQAPT